MCSCNFPYIELYSNTNNILNLCDANKLEFKDIQNISSISSTITPLMHTLLAGDRIPTLSLPIVYAIYNEYKKYNKVPNVWSSDNTYTQVDNNIWNYSVAKTYHFLQNLGRIQADEPDKVNDRANSLNKLMFTDQQKTEVLQVNRTTEVVKNIKYGKILRYVSEGDSKVRPTHQAANGTTLPANNKFWATAGALLSEWGCRCSVIEVADDSELKAPMVKIEPEKRSQASKLDIETGKVQVFREDLPIFGGTQVVRKYYKGVKK